MPPKCPPPPISSEQMSVRRTSFCSPKRTCHQHRTHTNNTPICHAPAVHPQVRHIQQRPREPEPAAPTLDTERYTPARAAHTTGTDHTPRETLDDDAPHEGLATGDIKVFDAECGAPAGLWAMRMRWLGDPLQMLAGDAGRRVVEAKPANGDVGALCSDDTGAFRSTELSDGRLEAKPEKGDCESLAFAN